MRIVLVSDTHITQENASFRDNIRAATEWIAGLTPDAVVHLGDITAHGNRNADEYTLGRSLFSNVAAPVHWLPGNHDIGDVADYGRATPLDLAQLRRFETVFGTGHWLIHGAGWQVVGLNAQLLGSDTQAEHDQDAWLDEGLEQGGGQLGVMLHKPFFRDGPEDVARHPRYLPVAARRRLSEKLGRRSLRFVAAGHTHQFRQHRVQGVEHVWVPSLAYRIPDALQETIGRKVVGAMILELTEEGYSFAFVTPPGVMQNDLTDHVDLYPDLAARL